MQEALSDTRSHKHASARHNDDEIEEIQEAFNIRLKDGIMAYLDSLGVLDPQVIAAHCAASTDKDMHIMKSRKVNVSHNPVSNLKLASGISPVPKMLQKGRTVSLGTDSPCSNNAADMFETMKTQVLFCTRE
jgi:5-methylthioadenosine/S-adenosylhomocysteine deaminase